MTQEVLKCNIMSVLDADWLRPMTSHDQKQTQGATAIAEFKN